MTNYIVGDIYITREDDEAFSSDDLLAFNDHLVNLCRACSLEFGGSLALEDAAEVPDLVQRRALRTWRSDLSWDDQVSHAILGLVSEAGEVAGDWDKLCYKPGHATPEMLAKLDAELGDVLYNLAVMAHLRGMTLRELSRRNFEKLSDGHGWKEETE